MSAKRIGESFAIVIAAFGLFALILVFGRLGFRLNTTASVPTGIYRLTDKDHGNYVTFCPAEAESRMMNERGYRPRGAGCSDGYEPLLKPLASKAGDIVAIGVHGITVNGRLLNNTIAKRQDGKYQPLPVLPLGNYIVKEGTVWALSTYNANSYDSRYFGAIPVERIISYAKPIFLF